MLAAIASVSGPSTYFGFALRYIVSISGAPCSTVVLDRHRAQSSRPQSLPRSCASHERHVAAHASRSGGSSPTSE